MIRQKIKKKLRKFDLKAKELLPGLRRDILLKDQTTFRIGGKAKYFFKAKTKQDLIKGLKMAKKINLPFFILGGGSNLLVDDKGYKGLVIKLQITNYKLQTNSKLQISKIYIKAGALLSLIISETTKNNLTGLEWAIGIPGTIGGAIWGNAGAFGYSMSKVVKVVEVFDFKTFEIKKFKQKDCKFNYRDSTFRQNSNLIILSVEFQLKKGDKKKIERKIKRHLKVRREKNPYQFSAGSVFKNIKKQDLNEKQLKLIPLEKIKGGKIPAAYLIEKSGLKGKIIGSARISEKHANFIINLGKAKSEDVLKLIDLVKDKVKKKFDIILEKEICYLK